MIGRSTAEDVFSKERGTYVQAFVWQNFEGFHITLEFENPNTGSRFTQSTMLAHDEASARHFIASEVAKHGFSVGDYQIAWKRS